MQFKVKITVIDKKLYPELQKEYCSDPNSGACPCYNIGDEFLFERYGEMDDFWHIGLNTLKETTGKVNQIAGGSAFPHCSEAWDAIARYVYTGLQGGAIMRGWMKDEHQMITCCSDGTRPVIFKIERLDYKVLKIDRLDYTNENTINSVIKKIESIDGVTSVNARSDKNFLEVYMDRNAEVMDETLKKALVKYQVEKID